MLHQNGRPVVLCGTVAPPEFEPLPERAFFSDIHYLALVGHAGVAARRLRARPAWREWDEPRIEEMLEFNDWLRTSAPELGVDALRHHGRLRGGDGGPRREVDPRRLA